MYVTVLSDISLKFLYHPKKNISLVKMTSIDLRENYSRNNLVQDSWNHGIKNIGNYLNSKNRVELNHEVIFEKKKQPSTFYFSNTACLLANIGASKREIRGVRVSFHINDGHYVFYISEGETPPLSCPPPFEIQTQLTVTDEDMTDIFAEPSLKILGPTQQRWYTTSASLELPQGLINPSSNVRTETTFFFFEGSVSYSSGAAEPVLEEQYGELVFVTNNASRTTGRFTEFTTSLNEDGVVGTQRFTKSGCAQTCFTPFEDGKYTNIVSLYADSSSVHISTDNRPRKSFTFVNLPSIEMASLAEVIVGAVPTNIVNRLYSISDWAADVDGILTEAWDEKYAAIGLTLTSTNGITVKFTKKDVVALNLTYGDTFTGDQITVSLTDPELTEGNSLLAALLYLKLTIDKYGLADFTVGFNPIKILDPEDAIGLSDLMYQVQDQKFSVVFDSLVDSVFSSLPPEDLGTRKFKNTSSIFSWIYQITTDLAKRLFGRGELVKSA